MNLILEFILNKFPEDGAFYSTTSDDNSYTQTRSWSGGIESNDDQYPLSSLLKLLLLKKYHDWKHKRDESGDDDEREAAEDEMEKAKDSIRTCHHDPETIKTNLLLDESGFSKLPRGWTKKTVVKAGKTLAKHVGKSSPKDKGFFDKCVKKMTGKMSNPQGYCASLKDAAYGGDKAATYWRGKDKTKKEVQKKIQQIRYR